ncbi:hypothetical protein [Streptomyces sp. Da 82-17]|uniref:hypothetical protein n=1 Tax=Streptomyces sp. Da 82-17 TaxID=3377116 RepID=UPI0038D35E11
MVTDTVPPVHPPRDAAVALRAHAERLAAEWERGGWAPSRLERRIGTLLSVATAGDGMLTAVRVRHALWEGSVPLLRENGGRLAVLLATALRALEADSPLADGHPPCSPGPSATGHDDGCPAAALDAVGRLLAAMAKGHAPA